MRYVPDGIDIVDDQNEAELTVLHVIGRQDRNRKRALWCTEHGQKYAVIQYCLRSTLRPSTEGWLPLWEKAALVWSYYNLKALCVEDGTPQDFPFYHAPLGANAEVFYPRNRQCKYVVATHGLSWVTESNREAAHAAKRVDRLVFHLGPKFNRAHITCMSDIDDEGLAGLYSECEFVSGLRRTEGFELPVIEGLLCGARPICFDQSHYRQWFDPWAVFIPEGSREEVIDNLETVFREGAHPVTESERESVKEIFDWRKIVTAFWEKASHGT
jgi:hypothetical protein